jgi:hypothetical protein
MNLLQFLLLLQIATPLALGQAAHWTEPAGPADQPEALVRSVYNEVVALHPLGVPGGAAFEVFKPNLSKMLLHRIDINIACQNDWDRQNPGPNSKPPFLEFGLFSGDAERAEPRTFQIERVKAEKDGSIRVYVRLTHEEPGASPWTWQVSTVLVRENGHFVVDDVIYLKDKPRDVDVRLSEYLSQGCEGPHWVGDREQRGKLKK